MTNLMNTLSFKLDQFKKIFTAIIIQKLIEEGKLNIRTPLSKFYPGIPYGDKLTIWNLLTHTSGIVDGNYKKIRAIAGEQDQVNYVRQHMISTPPHYIYASANYSLLAGIIIQVTQESYKQNVIDDILQPLHLNDTYFYQDIPEGTNLVYPPYVKTHLQQAFFNYDIKKQMSLLIGAGQIYSTPADYFKFLNALIEGQLIPKQDFSLFFPLHNHDYYNGLYSYYGNYQAGGSKNGYNLSFVINPTKHTRTVVFSSNYMLVPNKMLASQIFVIANRESDKIHWLPQY
ncbi:serine hydrolase domain-containing protein [Periweissella fabalis]|uniref:Serine hydrolase n=1 Tax=Periweissella fabalis TaxID=1070421 RepID=A0A7X6S3Z1_9LACO|nr:serine hydrolase [Periweissella fabalis]MCM0598120.1 serine hydrolase [Periweissella fabalis]NKZ24756.1 serine hydrolase [Periweissella fabalis]